MALNLREWLERALELSGLSEDGLHYLMGRGATPEVIEKWGIKTFDAPEEPFPDQRLHDHYGPHFERFEGKLVYPLLGPRGQLLGIDTRSIDQKDDDRYLLPESRWNPVWIGMIPDTMQAIYEGRDIIIVEGRFDVYPMYHVVGNRAVLGSATAHLSWAHVEFLRRWARRQLRRGQTSAGRGGHVYIVYDQDDTGRHGTDDALRKLGQRGVECSEIRYGRKGDDPGTIWDRGGVEALREAFVFNV